MPQTSSISALRVSCGGRSSRSTATTWTIDGSLPAESGGVLVLWAPNERLLQRVLTRVHGVVFSGDRPVAADDPAPLDGQKLLADAGWAS